MTCAIRRQCDKCPWKISTDPHTIPNGYSRDKHEKLACTIATPGEVTVGPLRIFACHESARGHEVPCVGWLVHQLGPGNNIPLRLAVLRGQASAEVETVGPQHRHLRDTLPRQPARRRGRSP